MTKCSDRLYYIDSLKGIAIILVILGHLIQFVWYPENYRETFGFQVIYSFHMGFFMMLSGFTVKTVHNSYKDLSLVILKKFINLILPFLCWAIIRHLVFCGPNIMVVLQYTENGLWFLHALFCIYTIFIVSMYPMKNKSKLIRYIWLFIVCIAIRKISAETGYAWSTIKIASFYSCFCLGYILADNKDWLLNKKRVKYYVLTLPFFIFLVWLKSSPDWQQYSYITRLQSSFLYSMIVVLMATLPLVSVCIYCSKTLKQIGIESIGKDTLGIYAIHFFVIGTYSYLPLRIQQFFQTPWGGGFFAHSPR